MLLCPLSCVCVFFVLYFVCLYGITKVPMWFGLKQSVKPHGRFKNNVRFIHFIPILHMNFIHIQSRRLFSAFMRFVL